MLGADAGGEFFGGAELYDLVADGEGVFRERRGRDADAELVADAERALVVGLAARDGDDEVGAAEEVVEVESGGGEGFLVGLVAEREGAREEHDAGGVGVGETDGAEVTERHGRIFDLGFSIFDLIRRDDEK